jgi:DUF218 domain
MICGAAWLLLVGLPSFQFVRGIFIRPLYVHDPDASGDAVYIMAGSAPIFERVRAATDLYFMRKVSSIYYLDDPNLVGYNFAEQKSQTAGERTRSYLKWQGIPDDVLHAVEGGNIDGWMSSRDEAIWFSQSAQPNIQRVVLVTSAPHTRRSLLSFQRKLPPHISVTVVSASGPSDGAEIYFPIWVEYLKLSLYWVFA